MTSNNPLDAPHLQLDQAAIAELRASITRLDQLWNTGDYHWVFSPERAGPVLLHIWNAYRAAHDQPALALLTTPMYTSLAFIYAEQAGIDESDLHWGYGDPDAIDSFVAWLPTNARFQQQREQLALTIKQSPQWVLLPDNGYPYRELARLLIVDDTVDTGITHMIATALVHHACRQAGVMFVETRFEQLFKYTGFPMVGLDGWRQSIIDGLETSVPHLAHGQRSFAVERLLLDLLLGTLYQQQQLIPITTWEQVVVHGEHILARDALKMEDTPNPAEALRVVYGEKHLLNLHQRFVQYVEGLGRSFANSS